MSAAISRSSRSTDRVVRQGAKNGYRIVICDPRSVSSLRCPRHSARIGSADGTGMISAVAGRTTPRSRRQALMSSGRRKPTQVAKPFNGRVGLWLSAACIGHAYRPLSL